MNRKERRADKKLAKHEGRRPSQLGDGAFATGVELHQAGRLDEAEALYRKVLAVNPRHADSLHLLGVIAHQQGRHGLAAQQIGEAIRIDPDAALYHSNLGNALRALGQLDQAAASYRRAIELQPDYPEASNNLGAVLREQGLAEEAVAFFHRAIELKPDFAQAYDNLGAALGALGRPEEAAGHYRKAIALNPEYAQAHNNFGAALRELGALDEAVASLRKAIALRPNFPEARNNLAIVLKQQGRLDEAAASCRVAIRQNPDFAEAYDNLGAVLADQGDLVEAEAALRKALMLRPDYADAHNNLGTVLKEQGRLDASIACFSQAAALKPDFANAHNNLGMALLAHGDMAQGWVEYEWRRRTPAQAALRHDFGRPQWRGEPVDSRTLLLHAEQGLGDTLQFCRYAALAKAKGARVVLQVQKPLVRLLEGLDGADLVIPDGEEPPDFDLHCPLLSLPLAVGTTLATIPSAPVYLQADPERAANWRARLAAMDLRGPKVGLVWAGGSATLSDRRRSLAPERLAPLFEVTGIGFFSLQKGGPVAAEGAGLVDVMGEMEDFADTAALVANLDLVISVDTAVAHMAAGMGKPVWLLDRFDPDWRWLTDRRDSPWYPSLRIYRQPRPGDWEPVLAEVARDLRDLVAQVRTP